MFLYWNRSIDCWKSINNSCCQHELPFTIKQIIYQQTKIVLLIVAQKIAATIISEPVELSTAVRSLLQKTNAPASPLSTPSPLATSSNSTSMTSSTGSVIVTQSAYIVPEKKSKPSCDSDGDTSLITEVQGWLNVWFICSNTSMWMELSIKTKIVRFYLHLLRLPVGKIYSSVLFVFTIGISPFTNHFFSPITTIISENITLNPYKINARILYSPLHTVQCRSQKL